jgi:hypothetical protein
MGKETAMTRSTLRARLAGLRSARETPTSERILDGRAAYRDEPGYTAPEMRPGQGENLSMRPHHGTGGLAAAMAVPAAGGALGAEGFSEPIEPAGDRREPTGPRFVLIRQVIASVAGKPFVTPIDMPVELPPLAPSSDARK